MANAVLQWTNRSAGTLYQNTYLHLRSFSTLQLKYCPSAEKCRYSPIKSIAPLLRSAGSLPLKITTCRCSVPDSTHSFKALVQWLATFVTQMVDHFGRWAVLEVTSRADLLVLERVYFTTGLARPLGRSFSLVSRTAEFTD